MARDVPHGDLLLADSGPAVQAGKPRLTERRPIFNESSVSVLLDCASDVRLTGEGAVYFDTDGQKPVCDDYPSDHRPG